MYCQIYESTYHHHCLYSGSVPRAIITGLYEAVVGNSKTAHHYPQRISGRDNGKEDVRSRPLVSVSHPFSPEGSSLSPSRGPSIYRWQSLTGTKENIHQARPQLTPVSAAEDRQAGTAAFLPHHSLRSPPQVFLRGLCAHTAPEAFRISSPQ
ncbi:unnamed protein product [Pleuronectes platessa]|uniref:Uncharacterized protein n=1 Tax=Pleuronectes platessa TaxID=8262 RepID=A0A9N7YI35_PLEPL|nr:unnamed protein product [Pleuronectes platessa]